MKKYIVGAILAVLGIIAIAACSNTVPSGQQAENAQQRSDTASLINNQPIPHFNKSQLRQNLIELETAQANGVQTTSFFFNQGIQDPIDQCLSIGPPIATTDQLSNPQQLSWQYSRSNHTGRVDGVISQMDPTGIYSGDSSGTYVMCVDNSGAVVPRYWEGFVQTVFAPATWDKTTHTVKLLGPPTGGFTKPTK